MIRYACVSSVVGPVTISTDGRNITGLHIAGDRYFTAVPADWELYPSDPLLQQAEAELNEYFSGRRRRFDVPVLLAGTPFQQQVWEALRQIPFGTATTYSDIAQGIGRPQAVRAVGTAVGRNPVCLFIPCHRVLARGGGIGGYVAGIECKKQLLGLEGVAV